MAGNGELPAKVDEYDRDPEKAGGSGWRLETEQAGATFKTLGELAGELATGTAAWFQAGLGGFGASEWFHGPVVMDRLAVN